MNNDAETTAPSVGARLRGKVEKDIFPVPDDLAKIFSPATLCIYEWTDYWLEAEGSNRVRVGDSWCDPVGAGLFQVRFENQLGLTTIQPFSDGTPLGFPLHIEVLSRKFADAASHLAFFGNLLNDLFARASRLPFAFSASTERGVIESAKPPSPLFVFYLLVWFSSLMRTVLSTIQSEPHRLLRDFPRFVLISSATEADADVIVQMLHQPGELVRSQTSSLARRLKGYMPARVWQHLPDETFDTPENRFVKAFLTELSRAAETLTTQQWWANVSVERRELIKSLAASLRQSVSHPMFDDVGVMQRIPSASQVLMKREGYRELFQVWQSYQRARRPLFAQLARSMNVRDVARLYETWVFFALIEEIGLVFKESPVVDLRLSDQTGLGWHAEARYGSAGKLVYNKFVASYSGRLRPDFTWFREGQPDVVLDAKFRLQRHWFETVDEEDQTTESLRADIYKMHTYRDALRVRGAVCVYPGDESVFYHVAKPRQQDYTLRSFLLSNDSGVGALAMSPTQERLGQP